MKKTLLFFVAASLLLSLPSGRSGERAKPLIGISIAGAEHHFDINAFAGAQDKAKALGADVLAFDGERRIEKQLSDIKTLISRKVDVLICILGDRTSLVPVLKEAREAGIPVVTADFNNEYTNCDVQTNNYAAISEVALKLVSDLKGEGKVAIFTRPGAPVSDVRESQFRLVLASYPKIEIVSAEVYVFPGTVPDTYNKVKDIIRAHPDIKAFWSIFDMPMIGAAQAIADSGMQGKIGCYGFDGDPTAIRMILDPESPFMATGVQMPYRMGEIAAETAMEVAQGKPIPALRLSEHTLATKENVKDIVKKYDMYAEIRSEIED